MYGSGFGKTGKPGLVKLGNHQGRRISLVNDLSKSYSKQQMIIDSKCLPRRNSSFFCSEYSTATFFRFAYGIYEINWVFGGKKIFLCRKGSVSKCLNVEKSFLLIEKTKRKRKEAGFRWLSPFFRFCSECYSMARTFSVPLYLCHIYTFFKPPPHPPVPSSHLLVYTFFLQFSFLSPYPLPTKLSRLLM